MHRGLKVLSTRVREVMKSENQITYKQVVDRLMTEEEIAEVGNGGQMEEKNVRRVFDALNVLIAAGVLKKHGKCVSWHVEPPLKLTKLFPSSRAGAGCAGSCDRASGYA